jgi:hypothetical protein
MTRHDFVALPDASTYTLGNARVPACCIDLHRDVQNATESSNGINTAEWQTCIDGVVTVDVEVSGAHIAAIRPAGAASKGDASYLDVRDSMVLPAFVDLHTHIGRSLQCRATARVHVLCMLRCAARQLVIGCRKRHKLHQWLGAIACSS